MPTQIDRSQANDVEQFIQRLREHALSLVGLVEVAGADFLAAEAAWLRALLDRSSYARYESEESRLEQLREENYRAHQHLYDAQLWAAHWAWFSKPQAM